MSEWSIAFSYGISYNDYLDMTPKMLNEAILGAQYKEARELKLPRLIAWMIGSYLGLFKSKVNVEEVYPLLFDVDRKKLKKEARERAEEIFRKRDAKLKK